MALIAGILILIMPKLLNYIIAIYLIVIGLLGLFGSPGCLLPLPPAHQPLKRAGQRRAVRTAEPGACIPARLSAEVAVVPLRDIAQRLRVLVELGIDVTGRDFCIS